MLHYANEYSVDYSNQNFPNGISITYVFNIHHRRIQYLVDGRPGEVIFDTFINSEPV